MLKKGRARGFTIMEVSLFLALSALLLMGVMFGITRSISHHRFNDTVNDLNEVLRRSYSEVINVQNSRKGQVEKKEFCSIASIGLSHSLESSFKKTYLSSSDDQPGRSDCAIYGKLIVFGANLDAKDNTSRIFTYDVIGDIFTDKLINKKYLSSGDKDKDITDDALTALKLVKSDFVSVENNDNFCGINPAGGSSSYDPQWGANIETSTKGQGLKAMILIVRSPLSGTVQTYTYENIVPIPENLVGAPSFDAKCSPSKIAGFVHYRNKFLNPKLSSFSNSKDITLCVGSDDLIANRRRAIRIKAGGHNASAIELLPADSAESQTACP